MKQGPDAKREQESQEIKNRVKTLLKRCAPDTLRSHASEEKESTTLAGILNDLLKVNYHHQRWWHELQPERH